MSTQVTKIADTSQGFEVEFTVVNTYKRTFAVRPQGIDQLQYARDMVSTLVPNVVEETKGVLVAPPVVQPVKPDTVIDLNPKPVTQPTPSGIGVAQSPAISDDLQKILNR